MKLILLFVLLLSATIISAQAYEVDFSDVKNKDISKYKDHKVDVSADGWDSKAIITIKGIGDESGKVKIMLKGTIKEVEGKLDKKEDKVVYSVVEAFENKNNAFEIFYDSKKIGTLEFTLQNANSIKSINKDEKKDSEFDSYIGALASANFVGNNKFLANLTPIVNLGGALNLRTNTKGWFTWDLDVNPYIGAEIDTKDSVSFIPALMLYGRAGFVMNNYLHFQIKKVHLTFMPFGFGLKFIPNLKDSGETVIQHNIRAGLSIRYADEFLLSAQITQGWHNLTSQSKKSYKKIFSNGATDINYITVLAQMALHGKNTEITNYVFFEWRGLLSKQRYSAFDNNSILTLGLRKTLELTSSGSSRFTGARSGGGKSSGRKVVHHNL